MRWGEIAWRQAQQNPDIQIIEDALSRPPARSGRSEHDEQAALFAWAAAHEGRYPALRWLFAIPNGGHRHAAVAAKLKAEGVKPGVPDLFLPVPRGGYHGLWIELKVGANQLTPAQQQWIEALARFGYLTVVCYGGAEAIAALEQYLAQDETGTSSEAE
ncbi:MAG TPA: VRR-NUC domain-containing protein [Caldilineaceae bacterium]|nr:VRR-NUC domain-containing protein [Caldilineaceae bacterium]